MMAIACDAILVGQRRKRSFSWRLLQAILVPVVFLLVSQVVYFYQLFLTVDSFSSSPSSNRDLMEEDGIPWNTTVESAPSPSPQSSTKKGAAPTPLTKQQKQNILKAKKAEAIQMAMAKRQPQRTEESAQVKAATNVLSSSRLAKVSPDAYRLHCSSPETVEWPLKGDGTVKSLLTPSRTCGIGADQHDDDENSFVHFFRTVIMKQQIQPLLLRGDTQGNVLNGSTLTPPTRTCSTVVFGVAFGTSFLQDMMTSTSADAGGRVNSTEMLQKNGHCFFMFTLQEDMQQYLAQHQNSSSSTTDVTLSSSKNNDETILLGHNWLIPIPQSVLPYANNRRNAKLLKYMGHYAFQHHDLLLSPKRIVWQDAKFFRPLTLFDISIPTDYSNLWPAVNDTQRHKLQSTCVTTMRLPIHASSYSQLHQNSSLGQTSRYSEGRYLYREHCKTVISALQARPTVTDSPQSLLLQCQAYMRHVQEEEENRHSQHAGNHSTGKYPLDVGLIDSAFIVWDESTDRCREFNQQLRCTMLDQLHCHSDRDQVLFPFVLYKLMTMDASRPETPWSIASTTSDGSAGDSTGFSVLQTDYQRADVADAVRIIPAACHWYHTNPIGAKNCWRYRWLPTQEEWTSILAMKQMHDLPEHGNHTLMVVTESLTQEENEFLNLANEIEQSNAASTIANNCTATSDLLDMPSSFLEYLYTVQKHCIQPLLDQCSDLIVLGISFSPEIIQQLVPNMASYQQHKESVIMTHGKCFFQLVLQEHLESLQLLNDEKPHAAVYQGHHWMIPLRGTQLPFQDSEQAALFFKYHSSLLFPTTKSVVWQDTSTFFGTVAINVLPRSYNIFLGPTPETEPCLTTFAVPTNSATTSKDALEKRENTFAEYCKTQFVNLLTEVGREKEASALLQQCHEYLQQVYRMELSVETLSHGLIDTDFLIWNESTDQCQRFNHELRGKIWSELKCRSTGWDSVVFPKALQEMDLLTTFGRDPGIPIDDKYLRLIHDIQFKSNAGITGANTTKTMQDMVRVVRTFCHWSRKRLGSPSCPSFSKNTAVTISAHQENTKAEKVERRKVIVQK